MKFEKDTAMKKGLIELVFILDKSGSVYSEWICSKDVSFLP
jgi:hypothetical protein